jgi:hypothetical protein
MTRGEPPKCEQFFRHFCTPDTTSLAGKLFRFDRSPHEVAPI